MAAWLDLTGMLGGEAGPSGPKSDDEITSLSLMAVPGPFVSYEARGGGVNAIAMASATFRFVHSRIWGRIN